MMENLEKEMRAISKETDIERCRLMLIEMFNTSKLRRGRRRGQEYSDLDAAVIEATSITKLDKLKAFGFNVMMSGEGLKVIR